MLGRTYLSTEILLNDVTPLPKPVNVRLWLKIIAAATVVLVGVVVGTAYGLKAMNANVIASSTSKIVGISGDGKAGFKDGPLATAEFNSPSGIVYDPAGNIWVADTGNNAIRVISNGVVTTVAGNGSAGYLDGFGTTAIFNSPRSIAVLNSTTMIIADTGNSAIRAIFFPSARTYSIDLSFNGHSKSLFPRDSKSNPTSVVTFHGLIYIAYTSSNVIGMINTTLGDFTVRIIAGSGSAGSLNGASTTASFNNPSGLAVDGSGNLYVADTMNNLIRRVSGSDYVVSTFAGNSSRSGVDGPSLSATFNHPIGVLIDSNGVLYVSENFGAVRQITNGTVSTMVNGTTNSAVTSATKGMAIGPFGEFLYADPVSHGINQIISSGSVYAAATSGAFKVIMLTAFEGTTTAGSAFSMYAVVQVTSVNQDPVPGIPVYMMLYSDSTCSTPLNGGVNFYGKAGVSDQSGLVSFSSFGSTKAVLFYYMATTGSLQTSCSSIPAAVIASPTVSLYYSAQPSVRLQSNSIQLALILGDMYGNPLAGNITTSVYLDPLCTVIDPNSLVSNYTVNGSGKLTLTLGILPYQVSFLATSGTASVCSNQLIGFAPSITTSSAAIVPAAIMTLTSTTSLLSTIPSIAPITSTAGLSIVSTITSVIGTISVPLNIGSIASSTLHTTTTTVSTSTSHTTVSSTSNLISFTLSI